MRKLVALLFVFVFVCAQANSQNVYTKDGMLIGDKKELVKSCVEGGKDAALEISGVKINVEDYCSCIMGEVMSSLTSAELKKHSEVGDLIQFMTQGENLTLLMECALPNIKVDDDFSYDLSNSPNPEIQRQVGIEFCSQQLMSSEQARAIVNEEQAITYCTCVIDGLYGSGYTYADAQKLYTDQALYNELIVPCLSPEMLKVLEMLQTPMVATITEEAPLIKTGENDYSVNMEVNGIARNFKFDPGASEVVINSKLEAEYLKGGIINKGHYLGTKTVELEDGSKISCKLLLMPYYTIGGFTVHNVETIVVPDGELILGKSLLDKFMSWDISDDDSILILKREQ